MKKYVVIFSIICLVCILVLLITNIFNKTDKMSGSDADNGRNDVRADVEEGGIVSADEPITVSDGYADESDAVADDILLYSSYDYSSWCKWNIPKHSYEDVQCLLSYEDTGWHKAYAEVLLGYETDEGFDPQNSRWDLYDLDNSGVPELIYMPYTSGGGRRDYIIYMYADGNAEMMMDVFADSIAYCQEDGLICWEHLMQGEYYNVILKLENDDIAERHSFYTNDGAVDEDAAVYTIDDEKVTMDEFYGLLRSPESKDEEANWKYIGARFVVGEYDDIFYMGIYPNVEVK